MASKYRIVEVPSVYGSMYRVEENFLFFFWFDRRTCSTFEDALAEIESNKRQDNLPKEHVVYIDGGDIVMDARPEVPPSGPPKAPPMRRG